MKPLMGNLIKLVANDVTSLKQSDLYRLLTTHYSFQSDLISYIKKTRPDLKIPNIGQLTSGCYHCQFNNPINYHPECDECEKEG